MLTAAPFATTPHARGSYAPEAAPPAGARRRTRFFARAARARARGEAPAPIVPPGSVTGHSLTLVISIMCFLASLTAATVYMINQSADAWLHDIASEVTVQVEPREGADAEALAQEVAVFLARQRGVRTAPRAQPAGLHRPARALARPIRRPEDAPVPRLVAVEVERARTTRSRCAPPRFPHSSSR